VKHSTDLVARSRQPDYKRIFEGLRAQIVDGKLRPGTQLPSTRELAKTWRSNFLTIHTALTALAREGWLDRRHGSGTYIADPRFRLRCAGIYHGADITADPEQAYTRSLHFSLISQLEKMGKDTQVFIDSRPAKKQTKILPTLAEAIRHERIQCVIAPGLNGHNVNFLARLPIPVATMRNDLTPAWLDFDMKALFRESVRRLAAQGCRSIGLISGMSHPPPGKPGTPDNFYMWFEEALQEEGLALNRRWERAPQKPVFSGFEKHGYLDFKNFWKEKSKPDGLIVFPDLVVRGVILAALEIGIHAVSRKMKFVFHRNAHLPILCPLAVTWATTNEDEMARGMIDLIQTQLRREEVAPLLMHHSFEESTGVN
jgi:DNA-binding transcriptional regulator YhcF (GntR family)